MSNLQVSVKMTIREGMLEGLKQKGNEYVNRLRQKNQGIIQYDWFISSDNKECEIRETYENSEACLIALSNLGDLSESFYEKYTSGHTAVIYGDPSPKLVEKTRVMGVDTKFFSLLQGL